MGRLSGKKALITGISSGIGAACARRFAEEGASIAGFDVQKTADLPCEIFVEVDVRSEASLEAGVAKVVEQTGTLDILVNAAGVAGMGAAHELEEEEWDRIIDINLKGTFLATKHVLPHMLAQQSGSVIHLASIEGLIGGQRVTAYNASKGGVVLLTRNMATDYGREGVRVNCLCPGFIETPMTAMLSADGMEKVHGSLAEQHLLGRFGQPEEIASAALFLASDDASFVTGHALVVDGGFTAGHRMF